MAVAASDRLSGQGQHPYLQCPQQQQSPPADDIISSFQNWFVQGMIGHDSPWPASMPVQPPSQPLGQLPSRSKHMSQGQPPHLPNLLSLAETEALYTSTSLSEGAIAQPQPNLKMLSAPNPSSTLSQVVAASLFSLEGARVARATDPAAPLPPREKLLGLLNATLRLLDATSGKGGDGGGGGEDPQRCILAAE